jgi:hypothetical protein
VNTFLFVLAPPYSGSTVLWRLLATSPAVSAMPDEGQHQAAVTPLLRQKVWDASHPIPWKTVRREWEKVWDLSRPILLEKSPPHLIRARAIEKAFTPAYFVAMIRNPYAFCEGFARRQSAPLAEAAAFWLKCAEYQKRNVATLERLLFFTYEELVGDPQAVAGRIVAFMPGLRSLDASGSFAAPSIISYEARPIQDMNGLKIGQLSRRQIDEINAVLGRRPALVAHFGYELLEAGQVRPLERYRARLSLQASRAGHRLRRLGNRVLAGRE